MTERRNPIEDDYIVFSEFGVDQRDGESVFTFFNYLDEEEKVGAERALELVVLKAELHLSWLEEGDTGRAHIRQYDYKAKEDVDENK